MKKKFTFLIAALMLLTMISQPTRSWGQTYKKVTSGPTGTATWDGEYIIVYETSGNGYVWTGVDANSNYISTSISSNTITKPNNAVSVTIASMTGGYSIMVNGGTNNGKYISGTSGSNTTNFNNNPVANTLTYSSGVDIASNTSHFVFNSTSGTTRYRYYKSTTYSGSSYKKPQLYKKAYTVAYNANDGSGSMTDTNSPYFEGTEVTLLANTFTAPSGYEFDSWLVKDASNNTLTVNNSKFTMPASNVTVTAQWRQTGVTQYNVAIAGGITGGTVTASPTSAAAGATITLTATPSSGYCFTSWNVYKTEAPNTPVSVSNNSFTMPEYDVTVSAAFTAYTVTLDPGNGSVASTTWTIADVNLPSATPLCNTWSFGGWSTSEVATQTTTAPTYVATAYVPTSNITLHAVYTKTESGGSFDSTNGGDYKIYAAVTANNITTNYYAQGTGTKLNSTTTSSNATTYTFEKPSGANYGNNEFAIYTMVNNTKTYITYSGSSTDLGTSNNAYKWTLSTGTKGTWRVTSGTSGRALIFRASTTNKFGGYSTGNVTANGTEYYDLEIGGGSTTYYHSTPDCMETVATPTFDTEAGTYDETQIILIECETDGAAIYYTLNGDEPTNSPSETNFLYDEEEGVEISVTTTLKAKAYKTGMHESTTASATYTIVHDVAEPTLPASQPFTTNTYSVTITVPENTTVYYTTDNSTPSSTNGTQFTTAFPISATTTVKAIAYDNDGCASDVVSATYTRAYTLAGAKALYNGSAVSDVTISLAGVQFIAKSGSYTYVQQGETGLLIYGTNNNSWDNGDVFTAGTVTGTITKYKENMEMTSFTFSGVEKEAGSLTASATNVAITDITGNFATYEDRYIALTSLTMNLAGLTLSDATNTLAIYDCLSALDGAVQPSDNVVVKGIVTSYTNNSNVTTYQIIPLAKTGITTGVAAALPTLAPAGGATAGEAPETATVTVTPATNTTVTYQFGEAYDEITSATVLTVPSTTATALKLVASRVFYNDNETTYYYKTSAPTWAITFYVNGSVDPLLAKEVLQGGNPIGTLPSVEAPSGYVHMGWAESTISTVQASAPPMVTSSTTVNNNMTLYAVFAIQTAPAQESYWTKITDLSTVTAGTYALLTENDYAFNGDLSAKFIGQHTTSAFSFDGEGKATSAPEGTLELTLAASGSGFTMYNSTKGYLYASGAAKENLKWQESEDSYWSRANSGGNSGWRYSKSYSGSYGFLRTLSSDNTFRTYGNLSNQELYMAKKTNGSPATYADYCTTVSTPSIPSTVSGSATIGDGEHAYTLESPITVSSNGVLTITGPFANSNPSLLIVEDGGQLIVHNDNVQATIKKTVTASAKNPTNWYTIASPVRNVNIGAVGDAGSVNNLKEEHGYYDLYRFNETKNDSGEGDYRWENYKNDDYDDFTSLVTGRGYLYRREGTATLEYVGEVNGSESEEYILTRDGAAPLTGFHLIGNPYSHDIYKGKGAAIDDTKLNEGFYRLTNGTAWTPVYYYGSAIHSGEGILVQANDVGTLTIYNRTETSDGESKYNNDNIMFSVSNSQHEDVAYAVFDKGHGLNKIEHRDANIPMLYISQNGEDYAIATMSDDTKMFSLNFKAMTMGKYTLSYKTKGEFNYLHVIDRFTGEDVDMLLEGEYSFVASPSDSDARFIVKLAYLPDYSDGEGDIFAYQNGSDIFVSGEGELQIFDVMGRFVMSERINGVKAISADELSKGVYVLRLVGNGMKTQKIVVK